MCGSGSDNSRSRSTSINVACVRQTIRSRIHSQFYFMWIACPNNATRINQTICILLMYIARRRTRIFTLSSKNLSQRWSFIYLFIYFPPHTFPRSTLASARSTIGARSHFSLFASRITSTHIYVGLVFSAGSNSMNILTNSCSMACESSIGCIALCKLCALCAPA